MKLRISTYGTMKSSCLKGKFVALCGGTHYLPRLSVGVSRIEESTFITSRGGTTECRAVYGTIANIMPSLIYYYGNDKA